jgi:tRNA threonylcarbamoyladenosine biosynthesis protein TsaE
LEEILRSLEDTKEFGIKLGNALKPGDILCLNGDLGAGKTTLTKSIGRGLGVEDYITSPTFALINEYEGKFPVYHFDTYRLEEIEEIDDLGFDEYIYGKGVSIIEWADKIEKALPREKMIIEIKKGKEENERILSIKGFGNRYEEIIEELKR